MPDRRIRPGTGRLGGLLTAWALVGVVVAPAALAQTDTAAPLPPRWTDTTFQAPFDDFDVVTDTDPQPLLATLRYQRRTAGDQITQATLASVDDPEDDYVLGDDCDIPPVLALPSSTNPGNTAEVVVDTELSYECNGRYLIEIRARGGNDTPILIRRGLDVAVPPSGVTEVSASLDQETRTATVTWTPLAGDALAPDVLGYVVERAGPATEESVGTFAEVATTDIFDDPQITDTVPDPGRYRYRVRATRSSPAGVVRSGVEGAATADVEQAPPPTTTTTTPEETTETTPVTGPRIGSASPTIPRRPTPTFNPPTTADTGFEDRLDYGDLLPDQDATTPTPPALASEELGQSVILDEEEGSDGVNVLLPAAGALVLLGWAGHIAYLNRLAKQL